MAVWRVMAELAYPSVAARDAGLARAQVALGLDGVPETEALAWDRDGAASVHLDANYGAQRGRAQALLARLRAEVAGGATGEGTLHLCPQDGPPETLYDCASPASQMERL